MAVNTISTIPVQSPSGSNTTVKFKFPIAPPPPNKIQDERIPVDIFTDMLGILNDTPKRDYKYYMDILLKRNSALPEIDENGIELSSAMIRQAVKDFEPTISSMKEDYMSNIGRNIVTHHVKLTLPDCKIVPQGPLMFVNAKVIYNETPSESLPLLVDCGATNSCLSWVTLQLLGYTREDICSEIQYSLSNVTEHENPHSIIGSVLMDIELESQSKHSILSVQFLILELDIPYGILGGLELEKVQTLLCLACKSMTSFLHNGEKSEWTRVKIYDSHDLKNIFPGSKDCKHTLPSDKTRRNTNSIVQLQNKFNKSINSMNVKTTPFNKSPQNEMPALHSENVSDQYLDDMNEEIQVPDDVDIETLDFYLDEDFKSLDKDIRDLLTEHSNLHPRHKNDVGQFPRYRAILTPAPNHVFTQEAPRRHDARKIKAGLDMERDLLEVGIIEPSESPYPCNALLTPKAIPFCVGSNTKADKHIERTTTKTAPEPVNKWRFTVDQRSHNSGLLPPPKIHLPKTSDILRILHGKAVILIDVANAFHSIEYSPESRQYTAFWGVQGTKFQFRRCCQGMSASPYHFSTALQLIFTSDQFKAFCKEFGYDYDPIDDIPSNWLIIYVDDILISVNLVTLKKRFHFILYSLAKNKLKINFTKLKIGTYKFAFLGSEYDLKRSQSSIKLDRRDALLSYREPRSYAEVLSRVASLNYNSRFLPGLQKFLLPLLHLLSLGRQGVKFHWKKQHAESWTNTKMLLFLDIKLYIPEPNCPRLVLPDACKIGFSGCLYSIIIKESPIGKRYKIRLENLHDKLFSGSQLNHHITKKEWTAGVSTLQKYEGPIRDAIWALLLSDCRSISFARRMKDTTSALFHEACYLSSFENMSHGYVPGPYVGISDALSRQFVDSTILEDFPQKALQQMPAIKYSKPAVFTPEMVQQIIWTSLHQGDMIDCTIKKTVLTNPPIDPEECLMQMMQAPPPEEFLNLLLQGAITKTHTNWLTASKKKFTQVDFNHLLSKCESPRIMSEISRIIELADLSSKTSHHINTSFHHVIFDQTSKPAFENISADSTLCLERNLSAQSGIPTQARQVWAAPGGIPAQESQIEAAPGGTPISASQIVPETICVPNPASEIGPASSFSQYRAAQDGSLPFTSGKPDSSDRIYSTNKYRTQENSKKGKYEISEARLYSTDIQKLPSNHHALLDTFPVSEQKKVMELLKLHSEYLSYDLLLAMDKNDFPKILKALLSNLSSYTKYIFLPFFLADSSQVVLKEGKNCQITLMTSEAIVVPSSSHIYIRLDLQLLCRSTFVELVPIDTNGQLFIEKMASTSVAAKHQFDKAFIYNVGLSNITIPKYYTLYTMQGLTNFPSNSGKVIQIRNLNYICSLQSQSKIFEPIQNQLYQDQEGTFLITCQNFLISTYLSENTSPEDEKTSERLFKTFPFQDISCSDTRRNTKHNYVDKEINPSNIEDEESSSTGCQTRSCRVFNHFYAQSDQLEAAEGYLCQHSKISLKHITDGEKTIRDLRDVIGPALMPAASKQLTQPETYFPAPITNIWPGSPIEPLSTPDIDQDEPSDSQILGDLHQIDLPRNQDLPPNVSKRHYNSLLFLARLLKTQDNLTSRDIIGMQKSEPLFSRMFDELGRHDDFSVDSNGILFKLIVPARGPKYHVLCLPSQFAESILLQFHELDRFHVPRSVMLSHYNNKFYTPGIQALLDLSVKSCLPCFLHNNSGIRTFKLYKRSITETATGEMLQLDLITGLPASEEGFTVLLLIVCSSSHYMVCLPLKDMLKDTIKKCLENIFHILPHPRFMSCDHQPSLAAVLDFCKSNDILCVKSTPRSKNELGSIDVACKIATQFLQKITTSIDLQLRLEWPRYVKILTDNLNAKHSKKNAFSRAEMFFGPVRFFPNQKLFASDIFEVCNQMLDESILSHDKKITESKRQAYNEEFTKLSFPRNSIIKYHLSKNDKKTVEGSKKLLPDTSQFFQVLRSGPTQVQGRNLANNTVRTLKKQHIEMVSYKENQVALRLIRDNFPKSLLWEFNSPHMKQSKQVYIQNVTTKSLVRKAVRFSLQSNTICLDHMKKMENEYIKRYGDFHSFPQFLKRQKIFRTQFVKTKNMDGQENMVSIFHTLRSCPAISGREISLLYK